ncbi:DUF4271 domain-containing protein [Telluribacter sp. SYSU D00476]|uniref:DUF4271 domain-containing protein n=1 Tax=Telluribacter sp. SYSU D00476 TaxID=2811430 RepID=UPI001FF1AC54|nr:DUF4271 domain-containing protein [Telluribacter sp. SYSU D00476]
MKIFHSLLLLVLTAVGLLLPNSAEAVNEVGPNKKYFLVYDYQNDWLVYSTRYQNYVPYTRSLHEEALSVSLLVDLLKNRHYTLLIQSQKQNYLFVEGALQKKVQEGQWLVLNIDSLYRTYRKDEILITLYGSNGIDGRKVLVANLKTASPVVLDRTAPSSLINIKPKPKNPFSDFSALVMLIILVMNVLAYNSFPMAFGRFINPLDFLDRDERDDINKLNKPYSSQVILFTILHCLVVSYLLVVFSYNGVNLFGSGRILSGGADLAELTTDYFKLLGITFLLFYLKYIYMALVGGMLNLDKVVPIHYFKALQITYLFLGLFAILVFSYTLYSPVWAVDFEKTVIAPFVIFYLLRFISLYILIKPSGSFINLYLFSYLCVIEIIPLIIGVKFAL